MSKIALWFTHHKPLTTELSVQFNALRGLAALLVCMGHAYLIFFYPLYKAPVLPLYLLGHAAVMVLFVNSGFLIAKSASANIAKNQRFNLRQFCASRVNRILPPFYFSALLMLAIYVLAPMVFATGTREFIPISPVMSRAKVDLDFNSFVGSLVFANEFFTKTPVMNFSYWSLPFEIACYAIFALLLWARSQWQLLSVVILFLALSLINITFACYVLVWLLGVWLALRHNHKDTFSILVVVKLLLGSLLILALCWGLYRYALPANMDKEKISLAMYGMVSGCWVTAFLYAVIHQKITLPRFFQALSGCAYTLYLIHFPMLLLVYGVIQPYIYGDFFTLLVTYWISIIVVVLIAASIAPRIEHRVWLRF